MLMPTAGHVEVPNPVGNLIDKGGMYSAMSSWKQNILGNSPTKREQGTPFGELAHR